ncbi:MAG: succinate dehydrogenase [Thermodesulfobacteriota bacterium]
MIIAHLFRTSVGRKSLMAASGAFLGLFLLLHALGNATVFFGREAFLGHAGRLVALGPLLHLYELMLLAALLLHAGTGLTLAAENLRARPVRYQVSTAAAGRTLGSRLMPASGIVIFLFLVIHLSHFRFVAHPPLLAELMGTLLRSPLQAGLYLFALIMLFLHISHGFWSSLQTFGINHPAYDGLIRGGAGLAGLALSMIFMLIVLYALLADTFLR